MNLREQVNSKLLGHFSGYNTELYLDNMCKLAEDFALEFGIYLEAASNKKDLQKEIKQCFKTFKKEYEQITKND